MIPLNINVNVSDIIPLLAMPTTSQSPAGARITAVRTIEMLNSVHVLKKTFRFLLIFLFCDIFNFLSGISCFCYGTWVANELAREIYFAQFGESDDDAGIGVRLMQHADQDVSGCGSVSSSSPILSSY